MDFFIHMFGAAGSWSSKNVNHPSTDILAKSKFIAFFQKSLCSQMCSEFTNKQKILKKSRDGLTFLASPPSKMISDAVFWTEKVQTLILILVPGLLYVLNRQSFHCSTPDDSQQARRGNGKVDQRVNKIIGLTF